MLKRGMRNTFIVAGVGICVAGAAAFAVRSKSAHLAQPGEILKALPASMSASLSDKEVAKWTARAKEQPKEVTAWTNLGDALMQKARETADVAYYAHAERVYKKGLEIDSKSVLAMDGMARVTGARHEFEESVAWAQKALALAPDDNDAYGLIGDAKIEMGDYKAAYENYQKMLDLKPDISSYARGAHLLYLTGNLRKGVMVMTKAIYAGSPHAENTAWCRAQLANMLLQGGHLLAAENTAQAALKVAPNNYHLLTVMGKVKTARKDYHAAIELYKQATAITPQHEAVVALGELYRLTGNQAEADKQDATIEAIHKLQKANGVKGEVQLARFYADRDRNLPEALKMAEEEYKTRKNVFVADTLAWAYFKNGRYADAEKSINEALKQRTPDAGMLFHAGMIYDKLGDKEKAQKYLSNALSLNPNFSPTYAPVAAETLKRIGRPQ